MRKVCKIIPLDTKASYESSEKFMKNAKKFLKRIEASYRILHWVLLNPNKKLGKTNNERCNRKLKHPSIDYDATIRNYLVRWNGTSRTKIAHFRAANSLLSNQCAVASTYFFDIYSI